MNIAQPFASLGRQSIDFFRFMGRSTLFLLDACRYLLVPPLKPRRILEQLAFLGARSFTITLITAVFTGMILTLQAYYSLRQFGSEGLLGATVAATIIRELGPVLSALVVAGRAGSSITAEIGIMRMTEQIDALEMMAVNPMKYVVSPKILAGLISLPLLTALFDVIGILAGYFIGVQLLGVNHGAYFGAMQRSIALADVMEGLLKSAVFGLVMAWISCFCGYYAAANTEGVTTATTRSVVTTSVIVLITDYLITSLML